jgi:hypothetical protein
MPNIQPSCTMYGAKLDDMLSEANLFNILSIENSVGKETPRVATGNEPRLDAAGQAMRDANGEIIRFARGELMFHPTGTFDADGNEIMRAETVPLISGTIPGMHPDYMNVSNYRQFIDDDGEDTREFSMHRQLMKTGVSYATKHMLTCTGRLSLPPWRHARPPAHA